MTIKDFSRRTPAVLKLELGTKWVLQQNNDRKLKSTRPHRAGRVLYRIVGTISPARCHRLLSGYRSVWIILCEVITAKGGAAGYSPKRGFLTRHFKTYNNDHIEGFSNVPAYNRSLQTDNCSFPP